MLVLTLKISLLETGLVLLCHLAAIVGSFYTSAPLWSQSVTVLLVVYSLIFQLRRACLSSKASLTGLSIGHQSSQLCYRHESKELGQLEPVYVSALLLVIRCRDLPSRHTCRPWLRWFCKSSDTCVVLFADSLSEVKLRQLRVYLRFGYFSSSESEKSDSNLTND